MKKAIPILLALTLAIFVLPVSKSFAYSGNDFTKGLTDTYGYTTNINLKQTEKIMIDNSLSSGGMATAGTYYIDYNQLVDIDTIYFNTAKESQITFTYWDGSTKTITLDATKNDTADYSVTNQYYYDLKETQKNVDRVSWYSPSVRIYEVEFFGSLSTSSNLYTNITNVQHTETTTGIKFSWTNPANGTFQYSGLNIYKDGDLITKLDPTKNNYEFTDLKPLTSYTFDFEALYSDGGKSNKKTVTVTTKDLPPPVKPITDLTAKADYNRVDLSWNLPDTSNFKKVNIYRDTVEKETAFSSFFGSKVYAAAQTKIFETNGTYFNDLTVKPNTEYEYTLTTTGTDGTESEGISTKVTTPPEPPPTMEGGNLTQEPNGDYTYTWTSPTTGKVKVIVGGQEYKIVPASDQKITIPKEQMKYTVFGTPDISIVPISDNGTVGEVEKPSKPFENSSLPFGVNDLLGSSTSLLWILSPFVLLALVFLLVPKLRRLLFSAFKKDKGKIEKAEISERRTGNKDRPPKERVERIIREPKERVRERIKEPKEMKQERVRRIRLFRENRERTRTPREPRARRERTWTPRQPRPSRTRRE